MKSPSPIDAGKIREYLLGNLCPEDIEEIENAYFASDTMLDEVAAVEEEMIEEYLGSPPGSPRWSAFESRYLHTPPHRRRVAMIRDLQRRARPKRRVAPYLPLAVAAAILIAAALGVVAVRRSLRTGAPGVPSGGTAPGAGAATVTITLPAVTVRGEGETPTVRVDGAESIALRLEGTSATNPRYRAVVRTVEGRDVWSGLALPPSDADRVGSSAGGPIMATVTIPASSLAADDYVLTLSYTGGGSTEAERLEVHRYFFRVSRR